MESQMKMSRIQKAALWVVAVAVFTDMLIYGIIVPILPSYAKTLGATQAEIGFLFGSYAITLLLATPILGVISDKVGRRLPMILGLFGLAAATMLFGFANSFWLLVLARMLQGISAAATWTAGLALLADVFPLQERGKAMGIALSGQAIGMLLGPTIGGFLYQWGGYHLPFIFAAVIALIDGILRITLLHDEPKQDTEQRISYRSIIKMHSLFMIIGIIILGAALPSALEPTLPLYLHNVLHASSGTIGLLFAVPTLAYGFTAPVIGTLSNKLGRNQTMIIGLIIAALCFPFITLVPNMITEIFVLAVLGISFSFLLAPALPELTHLADQSGIRAYGTLFAIYNTAYSIGMFCGPTLSGSLSDLFGLTNALYTFSLILLCYLGLFFWKIKKQA
ncbi:MFS transporter [Bacillus cereus group sp. BfR-BA-01380]|uniref:MFS transporter n=1 Tax=Bacillus cereus group sp. BfR-BA-01380 TaxID=2920324 RepID=UPI001F566565|nr:MFS transporter [Bacillus cereus group sp. BfR-BA-01380]